MVFSFPLPPSISLCFQLARPYLSIRILQSRSLRETSLLEDGSASCRNFCKGRTNFMDKAVASTSIPSLNPWESSSPNRNPGPRKARTALSLSFLPHSDTRPSCSKIQLRPRIYSGGPFVTTFQQITDCRQLALMYNRQTLDPATSASAYYKYSPILPTTNFKTLPSGISNLGSFRIQA